MQKIGHARKFVKHYKKIGKILFNKKIDEYKDDNQLLIIFLIGKIIWTKYWGIIAVRILLTNLPIFTADECSKNQAVLTQEFHTIHNFT